MLSEDVKELFISRYSTIGDENFYQFLISYALTKIEEKKKKNNINPEIELLNYSDRFLHLYRKENKEVYLIISKIFRKAAHSIYRKLLKQKMIKENKRFLNLVKK